MFNSKIMSLLLLVPYNLKMSLLYNEEDPQYSKRVLAGKDERFNNTNADDPSLLGKIKTHILKKDILDILNNTDTSIQNKLDVIDFYLKDSNFSAKNNARIAGFDITAGNLFREFDPFDNTTKIF
jgi:hypothetical protein